MSSRPGLGVSQYPGCWEAGREHSYVLASASFWKTGTSQWRVSPKDEGYYQSGESRRGKRGRKEEAEEKRRRKGGGGRGGEEEEEGEREEETDVH